jgi:hypothetical protein
LPHADAFGVEVALRISMSDFGSRSARWWWTAAATALAVALAQPVAGKGSPSAKLDKTVDARGQGYTSDVIRANVVWGENLVCGESLLTIR